MQAVELNKQQHLWNMRSSDAALGAFPISLPQLRDTLLWLQAAPARHRAAFDQYSAALSLAVSNDAEMMELVQSLGLDGL